MTPDWVQGLGICLLGYLIWALVTWPVWSPKRRERRRLAREIQVSRNYLARREQDEQDRDNSPWPECFDDNEMEEDL